MDLVLQARQPGRGRPRSPRGLQSQRRVQRHLVRGQVRSETRTDMIINARFLGLCQVHKGMHWGVGIGGFGCGKGCWEEVHDRALKIRASYRFNFRNGGKGS